MEARELRIGNLITVIYCHKIQDDFVAEATICDIDRIDSNSFKTWRYEPIPLTEEWLLKLSFIIRDKKYSLNYGGESMRFAFVEKPDFIIYSHGHFGFNTNEGRKNGDYCIKYVHQLQNLYHALTGKELEIQKKITKK